MFKHRLHDKRVFVTGITGSWGNEALKQLLAAGARITGYSRDELKQSELARRHHNVGNYHLNLIIGDVRDRDRITYTSRGHDVMIHLAALKQVGAGEYAPGEFVRTNILGTENLVYACITNEIERLVFVSTDKAVQPTTLYGQTKAIAEKMVEHIDSSVTHASICRFGNAIGSRGSVLEVWKRQIDAGQPITITEPDQTRFLITLHDAVQFVIDTAANHRADRVCIPHMPACTIEQLADAFAPKHPRTIIGGRGSGEKHDEVLSLDGPCSSDPDVQIQGEQIRALIRKAGWELLNQRRAA